jgi:hypothetical protein
MSAPQFYIPGRTDDRSRVKDRKERFVALLTYITNRNGFIISEPGRAEIRIECLPGSALPGDLAALGYQLRQEEEDGERILVGAIVEKFVAGADGTLEPLTSGSTKPIAEIRRHAGICRTERYTFDLP